MVKSNLTNKVIEYKKSPSQELFNEIYEYYLPKLKCASNIDGKLNEDLLQILSLTLWKVLINYKIDSKLSFNSYFWNCGRKEIAQFLDKHNIRKDMECEFNDMFTEV